MQLSSVIWVKMFRELVDLVLDGGAYFLLPATLDQLTFSNCLFAKYCNELSNLIFVSFDEKL